MSQLLVSGRDGSDKYDLLAVDKKKVLPKLDVRQIAQTFQHAYEQAQGYSLSGNEGAESAIDENLSIITESNISDYDDSISKLIQTFVANNSYLQVNSSSTANSIILEPRKIADINSPNGNNYAKATSLPFAYRDNLRFSFRALATNTAATQIQITGLAGMSGAIDLVDEDGDELVGGEIIANKFCEIVLTGTDSTKKAVLLKVNPVNEDQLVKTGSLIIWATNTAPSGYLECNGAAISRTTYSALFATIGTTFGVGDGTTTFNIPDLRGYFVRGWANAGSVDSGRAFGSTQQDAFQGHYHTLFGGNASVQSGSANNCMRSDAGSATTAWQAQTTITNGVNGTPRIDSETRPVNVALMYCIKY